jgi:hypothetical protein
MLANVPVEEVMSVKDFKFSMNRYREEGRLEVLSCFSWEFPRMTATYRIWNVPLKKLIHSVSMSSRNPSFDTVHNALFLLQFPISGGRHDNYGTTTIFGILRFFNDVN